VDLKPLQPSAFTGQGNVEQWVQELERYFTIAGISEMDTRRVALASTYLKDTASVWYNMQIKAGELSASSLWSEFRDQLCARFRTYAAARVARAAIRNLRHRAKVAGYTQEFQKHMQNIPDMSVTDQIDAYIYGLQHHIAGEVDREQPQTLADAMEAAQRIELLLATRRTAPQYGPPRRSFPSRHFDPRQGGGIDQGDRMDLSMARMQQQHASNDREFDGSEYAAEYHASEEDAHLYSLQTRGGRSASAFRGDRSGPMQLRYPGLSTSEVDRRYRENRCFNCDQAGHIARFCNKKKVQQGNERARQ
jgi:hypothetical protein